MALDLHRSAPGVNLAHQVVRETQKSLCRFGEDLPPDPDRIDPTRAADGPAGEIQWPLYWVFGTELPRVVLNEALAEAERNDPQGAYQSPVRVFVELHNPFPRAGAPGAEIIGLDKKIQ